MQTLATLFRTKVDGGLWSFPWKKVCQVTTETLNQGIPKVPLGFAPVYVFYSPKGLTYWDTDILHMHLEGIDLKDDAKRLIQLAYPGVTVVTLSTGPWFQYAST